MQNKSPKEEPNVLPSQPSMSRPPIPFARNKYTAKQTRTSALRASRSRSAETHFDEDIPITREKSSERHSYSVHRSKHYIDYMSESHSTPSFTKIQKPVKSDDKQMGNKNKEKSLLSNMRSKLSSSLSSHNLGSSNASLSSNSSNGVTPSCASFSRRLEVQSRIASLWKRSKSSSNEKTSDKNSIKDKNDLNRSITARRYDSFEMFLKYIKIDIKLKIIWEVIEKRSEFEFIEEFYV